MDKPSILLVGGAEMERCVTYSNMQTRFAFRYSRDFETPTFNERFRPAPIGMVIDLDEYWPLARDAGLPFRQDAITDLKAKIRKFWPATVLFFLSGKGLKEEEGVVLWENRGYISVKELHQRLGDSFATK